MGILVNWSSPSATNAKMANTIESPGRDLTNLLQLPSPSPTNGLFSADISNTIETPVRDLRILLQRLSSSRGSFDAEIANIIESPIRDLANLPHKHGKATTSKGKKNKFKVLILDFNEFEYI